MGKSKRDGSETPVSVSELNQSAKELLERGFPSVLVEGEVGRMTHHASGHVWFVIKDDEASIDAVCWSSTWRMLPVQPVEGMRAVFRGQLTIFPRAGRFQIVVRTLRPAGEGSQRAAFLALKAKLDSEGVTADERKRPLPFLPRAVGIVTSESAAALHDVLRSVRDRFPEMRCVLAPAPVQGPDAAQHLAQALERLQEVDDVDVIIIGRGGGSQEDLKAFNDETLARTIAASRVPVVSAVGHEIDVSISDLVADVRALTPTAAGEMVVPDARGLIDGVDGLLARLRQGARRTGKDERRRLVELSRRAGLNMFPRLIEERRQDLDVLAGRLVQALAAGVAPRRAALAVLDTRLEGAVRAVVGGARHALAPLATGLRALNPLQVLQRGFSVTRAERDGEMKIVRRPEDVQTGDRLRTAFASGDEVVSDVLDAESRTLPEAE